MNEPYFGADSDVGEEEASVPFDEEPGQPWDDQAPTDAPATTPRPPRR